jgi:hypothetical protein
MAKQGCAPKVTELYKKITKDPFSSCFRLGALFDKYSAELQKEHPEYYPEILLTHTPKGMSIIRLRNELILVKMSIHIENIRINTLRTM